MWDKLKKGSEGQKQETEFMLESVKMPKTETIKEWKVWRKKAMWLYLKSLRRGGHSLTANRTE